MIIDGKKYKYRMHNEDFHCALDVTMRFIGGKWKAVVIWYLRNGKKRFGELKSHIPDITDKMLSLQLKALEQDGIISRKVYPEVPPRVEYELTEEGSSLIPIVESIAKWGRKKAENEGRMVLDE
ncbi:winged helix-turn-helix transcriptional regulator [Muriicola sp. Z0-33]|uniref:winged helix-turn-helix transcriptional regulator n=1 Tax=Muriicola sp. Z0-33 TaxID=2816957 RepID=UPI002237632A|nr:helix-turn-helix domain-containing protein [Muriicola sp. Z0-33]MCW5518153.1 helix-turn-helix transcriptional regulator [Muriicola sp. Z0-33]